MASINVERVKSQLKSIAKVSQAVKHLLRNVLEALEENPSQFEELEEIPERIRAIPGVTIRKAKLTHPPHDYRLVFLHFRPGDAEERVEVIYAFRRQEGYPLHWDWIEGQLESP
jgi:hypothetical protein